MQEEKLLTVKNLCTSFHTPEGVVRSVDGVSFDVSRGETLALVGESGCGKTVTSLSLIGLLAETAAVTADTLRFDGRDLLSLDREQRRLVRGSGISMIFQEPMTSLNPVYRIDRQIGEVFTCHNPGMSKKEVRERSIEMLRKVGVPNPEERLRVYPHQLSGGLRQRVMIAMAMICAPELLIADEPTTALDVTIEAQILHLMQQLRDRFHTSILMITHNLGVVAKLCDSVNVMYLGQIVESCNTITLFENPLHPYTLGLIASIPQVEGGRNRLQNIPGMVPTLDNIPQGCRFCTRCPQATERCRTQAPELYDVGAGHRVRCFLCEKGGEAE